MCLRRAPEKYIAGAALDRAGLSGRRAELSLSPAFTPVSFLAYLWIMQMEATCFSETSDDFKRTTLRYIPEDETLIAEHYAS
jgi:hypothetical protein